ncbi:AAA family ATPase [Lentzea californiensis]|uniref:AAA family ATPase n=1 Tax=Lentzea californiensis TaxID=438851 RepID=UPI002164C3B2|nr:AAA family ATPase [Lentzea californiensis]MCR3748379.1 Gluconate kinase [Lentzea californiensis]
MKALLITGPVGVGKTTVAEAVGARLVEAKVPHAVIDLDQLSACWPAPAEDPFHLELQLRNLQAVVRNYVDAGVHRIVLAGVVESRAGRERYAEVVGAKLNVCRLKADLSVLHRRLAARHHDEAGLRWHLNRAEELEMIYSTTWIEDFVVSADQPVAEVAQDVISWWLAAERQPIESPASG